jgi:hypothetical protein
MPSSANPIISHSLIQIVIHIDRHDDWIDSSSLSMRVFITGCPRRVFLKNAFFSLVRFRRFT